MNTKKRFKNLRCISPEYQRIPHFNKEISNMTFDDIELDIPIQFPFECWIMEKVDGANMGVSWINSAILRNRNNILKKGYIEKDTPAKLQFRPAWNWINEHNKDIQFISKECHSPVTIYGEWLYAKHSIEYDKLPDYFLAYDIWVVEDINFLAPDKVEELLKQTNISYIKPIKTVLNSIDDIIQFSEMQSDFRNGIVEGIVVKTADGRFLKDTWKVVNKYFKRTDDFHIELIKNKLKK